VSLDWKRHGACASAEPETFFPLVGGSTLDAKRLCTGDGDIAPCPVRERCLDYALTNGERFGVWGGLSERERNKILRSRRAGRRAA
jgi:WhiB family redox-sensing transcriptional regulator